MYFAVLLAGVALGALVHVTQARTPVANPAIARSLASEFDAITGVRPTVAWTSAPANGDTIAIYYLFRWTAHDAEGSALSYRIATDPMPGDTAWVPVSDTFSVLKFSCTTLQEPLPSFPQNVIATGAHTVVLEALDAEGLRSAPLVRSFTSKTIAPQSQITNPPASAQIVRSVSTSVIIKWLGLDFDGVTTQYPVVFKYQLVPAATVDPNFPDGTNALTVQEYFANQAVNAPTSWDSIPGQRYNYASYSNLAPGTVYYFAVMAFDEAGAREGRFNQNANVLRLRALNLVEAPVTSDLSVSLFPVLPNPVVSDATIRFSMPGSGTARVAVYDAFGRALRVLRSGPLESGVFSETWDCTDRDGRRLPSGLYFVHLSSTYGTRIQRMVLLPSRNR
jgi:hypothetical protein